MGEEEVGGGGGPGGGGAVEGSPPPPNLVRQCQGLLSAPPHSDLPGQAGAQQTEGLACSGGGLEQGIVPSLQRSHTEVHEGHLAGVGLLGEVNFDAVHGYEGHGAAR